MKKIAIAASPLLMLLMVFILNACQSAKNSTETKLLKFNLQNGKGYDYEMTVNMDQEIMGQKIQMDMSTYYSMDVAADSGDIKTIVTSIDRFKMKGGAAGFTMEVDTDKPSTATDSIAGKPNPVAMLNKIFGAIKGQKFSMKVNPEGEILQVTGFENLGASLIDSLATSEMSASEKESMRQQFDKQFNAAEIKDQMQRFWYIFPNKNVKVGDSWQKNTEMKGEMPGKYSSTYTVKEIEGDMVTLEEKSRIESSEENIKLTGDVTGIIVVDSRLGLVVSGNQDLKMKAESQGMSFDIIGKTKIKGKAR